MPSRMSYRESMHPKNKKAKYYRKQGVHVYRYRDEDGIERVKIIKYLKRGKYNNVEGSQENQQMVQDSIEE